MNNITHIIKYKLQQRQWSVPELSRHCDIPVKTLQNILYYDKVNITIQTAIKLADALECTIDELIDRDNNINNKQKEGNENNFNHKLFQKCTNAVDTYLRKNKILKDKNQIIEIINHIYDIYLLKLTENIYFENIDHKDIENIVNLGNKKFS